MTPETQPKKYRKKKYKWSKEAKARLRQKWAEKREALTFDECQKYMSIVEQMNPKLHEKVKKLIQELRGDV